LFIIIIIYLLLLSYLVCYVTAPSYEAPRLLWPAVILSIVLCMKFLLRFGGWLYSCPEAFVIHWRLWLLVVSNIWPGSATVGGRDEKRLYEGWNFNSGNYLFTTDTK